MSTQSASLFFPFTEDTLNQCLKRAVTVEETIISAMKVFLITRKGSRLGSNFGSILPDLLFTLSSNSDLNKNSELIKNELTEQFVGVNILSAQLLKGTGEKITEVKLIIKFIVTGPIVEFIYNLPIK